MLGRGDHVHQLDAGEHGVGRVKRLEVEHRFGQSLDGVVVGSVALANRRWPIK